MAKVNFKYGTKGNLPSKTTATEGTLYVLTDTGELVADLGGNRVNLYSDRAKNTAKLTIGTYVFDGTSNVTIPIYDGSYNG